VFVATATNIPTDYHLHPAEELFYQLKGDISVRFRPLYRPPPHKVVIREGEL